jgi:hypothetical protein
MKTPLIKARAFQALFFLLFGASTLLAQDCKTGFYPFTVGTIMEQTHSDKKGKISSVTTTKITSVDPTADGYRIGMHLDGKDDKGKSTFSSESAVECKNGVYYFQFSDLYGEMMAGNAGLKDMEMVVSGDELDMPSSLTVGQTLPDAASNIQFKMNGFALMNFSFSVKNRKVAARENITTTAGSFDCYKITYDMDVKIMGNRSMKVTSWWASGIGMVRQETYNAKNELESKTELTKLTRS